MDACYGDYKEIGTRRERILTCFLPPMPEESLVSSSCNRLGEVGCGRLFRGQLEVAVRAVCPAAFDMNARARVFLGWQSSQRRQAYEAIFLFLRAKKEKYEHAMGE